MISDDDLAKDKSITVEQVRLLRESRGATNGTLQGMKEGALRRAIRRLDYPDLPRARQQQLLAVSRDDAGRVQPGALARALIEVSAMRRRLGATTRCAGVPTQRVVRPKALVGAASGLPVGEPVVAPAAGLAASSWVWLGPGNIGGRTRSIVIASRRSRRRCGRRARAAASGTRRTAAPTGSRSTTSWPTSPSAAWPWTRRTPNILYAGHRRGLRQPRRDTRRRHLPQHRRRHVEAARGHRERRTSWRSTAWPSRRPARSCSPPRTGLFRSRDARRADLDQGAHRAASPTSSSTPGSTRAQWRAGCDVGRGVLHRPTAAGPGAGARMAPWSGRVELAYAVADPRDRLRLGTDDDTARSGAPPTAAAATSAAATATRTASPRPTSATRAGTTTPSGPATRRRRQTSCSSAASTCGAATDGGDTLRRDQHLVGHRARRTPTTTRSWRTRPTTGRPTAPSSSATTAASTRPPTSTLLGSEAAAAVRRRAGPSWSTTTASRSSTAGRATRPAARSSAARRTTARSASTPPTGTEQLDDDLRRRRRLVRRRPDRPQRLLRRVRVPEHPPQHRRRRQRRHHRRPLHQRPVLEPGDRRLGLEAGAVPHSRRDELQTRCSSRRSCSIRTSRTACSAGGLSLWRTDDAKTPNTTASGPSWRAIKPSAGGNISAIAVGQGDSDVVWVGHRDGKVFRTTNGTRAHARLAARCDGVGAQPLLRRSATAPRIADRPDRPRHRLRGVRRLRERQRLGDAGRRRDLGRTWARRCPPAPVRAIAIHPRKTQLRLRSAPRSACSPARTAA